MVEGQPLIEMACQDILVGSEFANITYERQTRLFKAGASSQEIFDQAKNKKEESDVEMNWCKIKSPLSGTVLSRYHEPGELVTPGTKLLTLANIKAVICFNSISSISIENCVYYVIHPNKTRVSLCIDLCGERLYACYWVLTIIYTSQTCRETRCCICRVGNETQSKAACGVRVRN